MSSNRSTYSAPFADSPGSFLAITCLLCEYDMPFSSTFLQRTKIDIIPPEFLEQVVQWNSHEIFLSHHSKYRYEQESLKAWIQVCPIITRNKRELKNRFCPAKQDKILFLNMLQITDQFV